MFALRGGSINLLSEISQRLLQNLSFRSQRVQCLRVGNSDIPNDKRLKVALQHIHGIGRARAHQILSELNIENKPTKDLTAIELSFLREEVSKYIIGEDLKRCVKGDIQKLMNIQSYRGYRHALKLPCRGQRTSTNARTRRDQRNRDSGSWGNSLAFAESMERRQQREQRN